LVERCVLALTNENSWVLDPFAGVGSTVLAAIKNNRNSIGIEKEAEYCSIARKRIENYNDGNLRIRPINKPIHKPTGTEKVSQKPSEFFNCLLCVKC
jgi:DNA modification methylase